MLPDLHALNIRAGICDSRREIRLNCGAEDHGLTIDMKRTRPVGVDEDEWKRYLLAERSVPGKAQRPRYAYRNWARKDKDECRDRNPLHSAAGKRDRLVPYLEAPDVAQLFASQDALWMLNVKPPWATALVYGAKDVENRTWKFQGSRWTLIVASAKQPKKYALDSEADMNARLHQSGQDAWVGQLPVDTYQHIVGLVKLRALDFEQFVYGEGRCSVWYNGDYVDEDGAVLSNDVALVVEAAFPFQTPIPYTDGTLSMTRFATVAARDQALLDRVKHQLTLLSSSVGPPTAPGGSHQPLVSDDNDSDQGLTLPLPSLPPVPPPAPNPVPLTQPITSLNEWGSMAWTLEDPAESVTTFIDELNAGAQEWMANHLARALVEPPRKPEFAHGHRIWQNTDASIRQTILNYFDLRTREGAIRLFDSDLRKTSIPTEVRTYLNDRLMYVKQGNKATGQGNSHKSWTLTGFGIWTKIWTSVGLKLIVQVRNMMKELGFATHITGVPHIIYKPPRGDNLPAHHDKMPTSALLQNLREHVASADSSVEAWVKRHGMQLLAHIRGGHDDGYTYTVGPLDCKTLLFCMELIVRNPPDIAAAAWSDAKNASNKHNLFTTKKKGEGPYFVDWYKLVGKEGHGPLNAHLSQQGLHPLRILPIKPFTNDHRPYLAMWPFGFPHGSMSNQEPRVTLTIDLENTSEDLAPRSIERLKNLATLAHAGSTDAEVAAAEAAFQADTRPYHDGNTHKNPEMMADLQRHASYATDGKPVGPFASIAPTRADVDDFLTAALTPSILH